MFAGRDIGAFDHIVALEQAKREPEMARATDPRTSGAETWRVDGKESETEPAG